MMLSDLKLLSYWITSLSGNVKSEEKGNTIPNLEFQNQNFQK
jgi:hypothetical protein